MASPSRSRKIAPSILAADFAHLADEVAKVTPECDLLHVDVMDGHFVPNISIGPAVVTSLRPVTDLYLDCHLMIENPGDFLDQFAKAGADSCTIHVETAPLAAAAGADILVAGSAVFGAPDSAAAARAIRAAAWA